jgi:hypothetical protein
MKPKFLLYSRKYVAYIENGNLIHKKQSKKTTRTIVHILESMDWEVVQGRVRVQLVVLE